MTKELIGQGNIDQGQSELYKWGSIAGAIILSFLSPVGWSQQVGVGTTMPMAKLHIEVPPGYTSPLLQVNIQGSTPYLIVLPNGNVGIGVAAPSEVLDINGNIQFSGALMPGGNAGNSGQILVSQGAGMPPQWQNASILGDNWGSQTAVTSLPIIGNGTSSSPITLLSGSAAGDVLIYNGSSWVISPAPWDSVCNSLGINVIPKWVGSYLCNSVIYDDGSNVGVDTLSPEYKLDVKGDIRGWRLIPTYYGPQTFTANAKTFTVMADTLWDENKHFYILVRANPGVSWVEARDIASKYFGGYLVTVTSQAEQDLVSALINSVPLLPTGDAWIGYTDARKEGEWEWITGEIGVVSDDTLYTNWASGEPNDLGGEDCAILNISSSPSLKWNDNGCNGPYYHPFFIVEISYHESGY